MLRECELSQRNDNEMSSSKATKLQAKALKILEFVYVYYQRKNGRLRGKVTCEQQFEYVRWGCQAYEKKIKSKHYLLFR